LVCKRQGRQNYVKLWRFAQSLGSVIFLFKQKRWPHSINSGMVILYKRLRPFFLGLMLGQISCSGFWSVIDYITGESGNIIYVGMLI
jgi:hypothetical protein